ncbi:Ribosome biogenesis protein nsa1 (NOP7-associated protein 1) [Blastocladiella emersonii ATCC 22665]|nr:Ribosome biogenesis protein nsa1 (NOP7-associated protein 1) [Blastocladiella emersonii ATCC 22665]
MLILVGTEGGQLKSIPYAAGVSSGITAQQSLIAIQPGARAAAEAAATAANSQVVAFGTIDKATRVVLMANVQLCGRELVLVARANGIVDVWDHALTGSQELNPVLASIPVFSVPDGVKGDAAKEFTEMIGLDVLNDETIMAVNRRGTLAAVRVKHVPAETADETDIVEVVDAPRTVELGAKLCRVRTCGPTHPHLLALGGEERDLHLMDLNRPLAEAVTKKGEVKFAGLGDAPTAWNGELNPTPVWFAKNVPNDMLDLPISVWITDLQFMNPRGTTVAVCTMHHEVKVYHAHQQRRPAGVMVAGESPLRSLARIPDRETEVVVADAKGAILHVSLTQAQTHLAKQKQHKSDPAHPRNRGAMARQGKVRPTAAAILGRFPGPQGAIRQVLCDGVSVIAVGLDRFVRFWDLATRQPRVKFFAKQRLEALCVWRSPLVNADGTPAAPAPVPEPEEVGEEVWDQLEALEAKQAAAEAKAAAKAASATKKRKVTEEDEMVGLIVPEAQDDDEAPVETPAPAKKRKTAAPAAAAAAAAAVSGPAAKKQKASGAAKRNAKAGKAGKA